MKIQEIQPIILASQSPRRRDILQQHGVSIVLRPTHTDEHLDELGAGDGEERNIRLTGHGLRK